VADSPVAVLLLEGLEGSELLRGRLILLLLLLLPAPPPHIAESDCCCCAMVRARGDEGSPRPGRHSAAAAAGAKEQGRARGAPGAAAARLTSHIARGRHCDAWACLLCDAAVWLLAHPEPEISAPGPRLGPGRTTLAFVRRPID
jgi:hypothetical protein